MKNDYEVKTGTLEPIFLLILTFTQEYLYYSGIHYFYSQFFDLIHLFQKFNP